MFICDKCGNGYDENNIKPNNFFKIPVLRCGVVTTVFKRYRTVFICDDCLEEYGIPIEEYMDSILFAEKNRGE